MQGHMASPAPSRGASSAAARRPRRHCHVECLAPLGLAILAFAILLGRGQAAVNITYGTPYGQCFLPPVFIKEKTGSKEDDVFALCLKTSSGFSATFENAEKFFIGNSSNPEVKAFGVLCANISVVLQIEADNVTLNPAELPLQFASQSWDLTTWQPLDPSLGLNQTVELTISNNGPTSVQFTGIDFKSLGLPSDFVFGQGNTTTISFDRTSVQLQFDTLPLLERYLLGDQFSLPPNSPTGVVILRYPNPPVPNLFAYIMYAIVNYNPASVTSEFSFFLYESAYYLPASSPPPAGSGSRRRLLLAAPKSKAPATACAKGCCVVPKKPAKDCVPGNKLKYPACLKSCGCFC